jgi:hypothetical protein
MGTYISGRSVVEETTEKSLKMQIRNNKLAIIAITVSAVGTILAIAALVIAILSLG